jgi:hypothetical protein
MGFAVTWLVACTEFEGFKLALVQKGFLITALVVLRLLRAVFVSNSMIMEVIFT